MNKIIPIILLASLLLTLFGCSAKKESSSAAAATEPSTDAQETAAATMESKADSAASGYTTREIYCDHGEGKIYGVAYIADESRKTPLVILSHGLSANHNSLVLYAETLAENGYSAYVFDFPNGSNPSLSNKSGTETTKMSVMTEAEALKAVVKAAKNWEFADSEKIFLLGESQGGLVSSIVACDEPENVAGLMLLYPAFNIPQEVRQSYETLDDVPETYNFNGWIEVGKVYAEDVWDLDIYDKLSRYNGRVLIVHGDSDSIVDVSYAERAAETLPDCELHIIKGSDHGFRGDASNEAVRYILEYLS